MPVAKSGGGKKFDPIPQGVHQGVCISIIDVGTQVPADPKHKAARKVWITWELPHETLVIDGNTKCRQISEKYTLSMHEKGRLRPMLASWRGTAFTADEVKAFDMSKLIGRNCQLNVVHNASKKDATKVFANISAVIPLPKGMPPVAPTGDTLVYDIPEAGPITIPASVPEWMAEQVKQSVEYKERMGSVSVPDAKEDPEDRPF